ncbi:MAG: hypothetical protein K2Y56_18570 [Methylobacterium sp.]|uniref:hypothetical protein n=1 Tax=Methylobacterium sp. TaxID=409 RepID=UPI0025DFD3E2|nr:hypothetical protein [Methylobacterium sp.]MBX9933498.1 hypothetical protein [Methylobacterium sp.]
MSTSPLPSGNGRSEFDLAQSAWLTLWRTVWLDLPLAWAGEIDRLLFRWIELIDTAGPHAGDGPQTASEAIALSLGCDGSEGPVV